LESPNKAVEQTERAEIAVIVAISVLGNALPHVLLGHADVRTANTLLEVTPEAFNAVHMVNASDVFLDAVIDREVRVGAVLP
jgi:hypothetical protein